MKLYTVAKNLTTSKRVSLSIPSTSRQSNAHVHIYTFICIYMYVYHDDGLTRARGSKVYIYTAKVTLETRRNFFFIFLLRPPSKAAPLDGLNLLGGDSRGNARVLYARRKKRALYSLMVASFIRFVVGKG